jgi:hypothetical protein
MITHNQAPFDHAASSGGIHRRWIDKAHDAISELSNDLYKDCHMPNSWDIGIDKVNEVEFIHSNDRLVELHLVPTNSMGRSAFKYEVFRIFPNDGPDDGRVFSSLQDAAHWFIHCQIQMRMNANNHHFVNVIEPDREKVTQSILADLFDGDREYLGQVRESVRTALKPI